MFIGEYSHTLDEKNRLAIPAKFRAILAKGAVVTKGLDHCLFLYTKEAWNELAKKLAQLPVSQANTRAFSRLMLAGAMDVALDKQGRIVLPDYLKKYASLHKKLIITGLMNRLEIWDAELWGKYKSNTEKSSEDIAEALGELAV
ncbi:division/cell wall cluster transcriptional repressor MraZ [Patescibacteria group bacterium]|nr:division/cell wall cluster transcriptional repressor MraZ [Patescibacteria group bacterium]